MTGDFTPHIGIIGLGYVGLPLAVEFGKKYPVTGFDINTQRIEELSAGNDHTLETDAEELRNVARKEDSAQGVFFTTDKSSLHNCNVFIVTVPTPVDRYNNPDLTPLLKATETVAQALKKDDIVIYESTVYPGCTEEACIPILEKNSGLVFNADFFCGYSPERINPGDKTRTLPNIKKVTSGSTKQSAQLIDDLYSSIIPAGTHLAPSIKVAEAAKVIENAQRDINIAFVNELSKIFTLLGIDTNQVLEAASTKWNFLSFKPGLVGGHCIGVDPYYLAQKAISVGYYPEIILSGRRINDSMGTYIADKVVKLMLKKQINVWHSDILVLGITFKENCPDVRNTKVVDVIRELKSYKANITVFDPWASCAQVKQEYGIDCVDKLPADKTYDAIILAVSHAELIKLNLKSMLKQPGVLYDVKGVLDTEMVDGRL
ncbi:UDP-N-acetyl-D-galactosamine dehydrogenase [Mucilaginibacter sp. PPCGB 2223]|uniref:nucleotide sugar dehydrogenase n=1 Tax=Mucilaginibacter sp. PPCGB 2223 TaxID=1886027 RepID=UPI0008261A93|nr:nucleotide sugar dehydrogenase [Mucilaginibacter sp. PPCGB 2223]OCX54045.1 UDP-N-acetyl-D-galactosamine dehydrogenase [Mucilaginibacter sp. PPCGB 2223]